jgi:lipopolysaccharide exporter
VNISNREAKRTTAAKGAVLVVAMRWVDRLIGLVSTMILARLLLPEDFGIVAMASIVVGLVDTLLDLGVGTALIQNKNARREDFNTAWTVRLMQAGVAAVAIWLAAPFAADYFRDPRVSEVIRVMALAVLIGGFENIGIVAFQKNMEFGQDFRFFFFRRFAGFVITMILVFWLKSYWAMVFGSIAGRSAGVLLSYRLHDFRPRLSLARVGKLWGFSQWILVRNLGGYGQDQIDKFLVGRRDDAASVGRYMLSDEIATMPTTELLAPLSRVLFPVFVNTAHDATQLRLVFCKALGVQSLVALPAGVGLCMVAGDAVPLMLGDKWLQSIPLVQILSLMSVFSALAHSCSYLLLALGRIRIQALLTWARVALFAFIAIVVFPEAGAHGIAFIRLAVTGLGLALLIGLVLYYVEYIRLGDFAEHTWRPGLATCMMALALWILPKMDGSALLVRVMLEVGFGAIIYLVFILIFWRIAGCRDGAENYLLEQLRIRDRLLGWMRVRK